MECTPPYYIGTRRDNASAGKNAGNERYLRLQQGLRGRRVLRGRGRGPGEGGVLRLRLGRLHHALERITEGLEPVNFEQRREIHVLSSLLLLLLPLAPRGNLSFKVEQQGGRQRGKWETLLVPREFPLPHQQQPLSPASSSSSSQIKLFSLSAPLRPAARRDPFQFRCR